MNEQLLGPIKAVFLDVDGVLSRQTISLGDDGQPTRTVNIRDGYAIQHAVKCGIIVAIVSGAKTENIQVRYRGLGVKDVVLGASVKINDYERLKEKYGLADEEILYMGDDIPDYQIMQKCGLPACPSDAAEEIKGVAQYISPFAGGEGCVRDVIEKLMREKGLWMHNAEAFGW